jgi:dihydrolipoamide dehydrogenase
MDTGGMVFPTELMYDKDNHTWFRFNPDGTCDVGRTEYHRQLSGDMSAVLLPHSLKIGDQVQKNQDIIELESSKAVFSIQTPASGTIVELGPAFKDTSIVNTSPHDGVILRLRPDNSSDLKKALMTSEQYGSYVEELEAKTKGPIKAILIGSGPATHLAAEMAETLGFRTLIVEEKPEMLGGVCLNRGCIPTKALLSQKGLTLSFGDNTKRAEEVVRNLRKDLDESLNRRFVSVVYGRGRIVSDGTVEVTDADGKTMQYSAGSVILATGSKPRVIDKFMVDKELVITSDEYLMLREKPGSMVIIGGGGVIGLEAASRAIAQGCRVTVVDIADQMLPGTDREVAEELRRQMEKSGLNVITSANIQGVETIKGDGKKQVSVRLSDGREITADKVLLTVGRVKNIRDIGLEKIAAENTTDAGMHITGSTFGAGDVVGRVRTDGGEVVNKELAYVAGIQGVYALLNSFRVQDEMREKGENFDGTYRRLMTERRLLQFDRDFFDYKIPYGVFTKPSEVASIGLSQESAAERFKGNILVQKAEFGDGGFVKLIADREGKLIGAHMIGDHVTEDIHMLTTAVANRSNVTGLFDGVTFIKGSHAETVQKALTALAEKAPKASAKAAEPRQNVRIILTESDSLETASVGLTAEEARKTPGMHVQLTPFSAIGRAHAEDNLKGEVALISDKDDILRGVQVKGRGAARLIAPIAVEVAKGIHTTELLDGLALHPVMFEAVTEAAHRLRDKSLGANLIDRSGAPVETATAIKTLMTVKPDKVYNLEEMPACGIFDVLRQAVGRDVGDEERSKAIKALAAARRFKETLHQYGVGLRELFGIGGLGAGYTNFELAAMGYNLKEVGEMRGLARLEFTGSLNHSTMAGSLKKLRSNPTLHKLLSLGKGCRKLTEFELEQLGYREEEIRGHKNEHPNRYHDSASIRMVDNFLNPRTAADLSAIKKADDGRELREIVLEDIAELRKQGGHYRRHHTGHGSSFGERLRDEQGIFYQNLKAAGVDATDLARCGLSTFDIIALGYPIKVARESVEKLTRAQRIDELGHPAMPTSKHRYHS